MLRVTSKYEVHTTKCYREHTLGMINILSFLLCRLAGMGAPEHVNHVVPIYRITLDIVLAIATSPVPLLFTPMQ